MESESALIAPDAEVEPIVALSQMQFDQAAKLVRVSLEEFVTSRSAK